IWRPSAFAVLRLITSSNFVGCSTGSSAGWAPLENPPAVDTRLTIHLVSVGSIADKATGCDEPGVEKNPRKYMACRQRDHLIAASEKEQIGGDNQCTDPLLDGGCEHLFEIVLSAGCEHNELLPNGLRCRLCISQLVLAFRRAIRVHKDSNHA